MFDMTSVNFEFLRPMWPDLTGLGGFAEQYALPDPSSAAVKLRSFAEQLVGFIFHKHGLPPIPRANLNELLESQSLRQTPLPSFKRRCRLASTPSALSNSTRRPPESDSSTPCSWAHVGT